MEEFDEKADEDNGYSKPAGPWWKFAGYLIGTVIAMSIFWYLVTHR